MLFVPSLALLLSLSPSLLSPIPLIALFFYSFPSFFLSLIFVSPFSLPFYVSPFLSPFLPYFPFPPSFFLIFCIPLYSVFPSFLSFFFHLSLFPNLTYSASLPLSLLSPIPLLALFFILSLVLSHFCILLYSA